VKIGTGDILKEVPNVVWVCLTIAFLGVIGAYVALSTSGTSTDDLSKLLNSIMNFVGIILSGGSVAIASSAAVNAKKAVNQTNGGPEGLKETLREVVQEELNNNVR